MAQEIYYDDIVIKGEYNNRYYEQSFKDRMELTKHIVRHMGRVMYRHEMWTDARDWKLFRAEMMDEVKWGKGKHGWKPSIDDMLWKLLETAMDDKYKMPSRYSVKQIENYNKYSSIIAKVWNNYHPDKMITASELQVKMIKNIEQPQVISNNLDKFVEVKK
jgi:hypothetical protein